MSMKPKPSSHKPGSGIAGYAASLCCIVLAASIHAPGISAAGNETSENDAAVSENSTAVNFHDGRLSVSAQQASLVELMRLVGEAAGFEVTAYGDLSDRPVSVSFSELQLAEALRKLLRDTSAVVSYRASKDPGKEPAVSKIFLLGSNTARAEPIRIDTVEPGLETSMRLDEIQSGDAESRMAAIERTEGLADDITLDNLAFSLNHDPDPEVRLKAISALEQIGGASAAGALESGLGDRNPRVRQKVVQALGRIEDERIPLWLAQVLMGDPSAEVRLVAVRSIARKEGDVARIFLEAASGDSSSAVRQAAEDLIR